jgi:hypothetical protein
MALTIMFTGICTVCATEGPEDENEQGYATFFFDLDNRNEAPDEIYEAFDEYINEPSLLASDSKDKSNFYDYYFTDYRYVHLYVEAKKTLLKAEGNAIAAVSSGTVNALSVNLRQYDEDGNLLDENLNTETSTTEVASATSGSKTSSSYVACNFGVMVSNNGQMFTKQLKAYF